MQSLKDSTADAGRRDGDLSGRVAVVTGGSRGIGLAIVSKFLVRGARVLFTARRPEGLEAARAELKEVGDDRFLPHVAHSADPEQVRGAFETAVSAFGKVDIVVNNAATNPTMAPLADLETELFDKILSTNLRGYFLVAKEGVRRMRGAGQGGVIVNVSTIGAYRHLQGLGAYGVSKAAVNMLTRALAAELAPEGIRVNGVAPGVVRTRFSEALWKDPQVEERLVKTIPAGRIAEPSDVADVIVFLASDEARYINGETVVVDGGLLTT